MRTLENQHQLDPAIQPLEKQQQLSATMSVRFQDFLDYIEDQIRPLDEASGAVVFEGARPGSCYLGSPASTINGQIRILTLRTRNIEEDPLSALNLVKHQSLL
ncbi:MAG: hypothetical protein EZS28_050317 [Streblomastix strix]|uniref:Uncharacterized protein n=1 Tax=Streblomastix strix TaxID=222440 RepID=A0A5J4T6U2_9EUKA|nr:MAG: hypothetical protein EZS28_050317 [Streblomastix strix]